MLLKDKLITIIVVTYNVKYKLPVLLNNIVSQKTDEIELVLIDGNSTDGTKEIIKEYSNIIDYYQSEKDIGIYDAMNKGLKLATGDIICFLNADDLYAAPNVLSRVAQTMARNGLDAIIGDVGFFRQDNVSTTLRRYRSDRFTPKRLAWGWMPAHPALFLRRKVFERVGYFKTDYQIAGDYEHVVRAFCGAPLKYAHMPEILVRMQMGGVSTRGLRATITLNQEILRACRENGVSTNYLKILTKYPAKLMEFFRR